MKIPTELDQFFRAVDESSCPYCEGTGKAKPTLQVALFQLCDRLDPLRLGPQWPDPISFDGRPLELQAIDLLEMAARFLQRNVAEKHKSEVREAIEKVEACMKYARTLQ